MKSRFLAIPAAAVFLVCAASPALAQFTGRIGGVVRDETNGPLRGVVVRLQLPNSDAEVLSAVSDDRGRFVFAVRRAGTWMVTFELPGFYNKSVEADVRQANAVQRMDVKLDRHESPESSGALAGVDSRTLSTQLAAAAAMMEQGQYDQAITAYRDLKTRIPALTLVNLQLGDAYLMKKSYPDAESAFQEVLTADAKDPAALMAMGSVKEAEGNDADAKAWYLKATTADASWTQPLMKLAALAGKTGDRAGASAYLSKVIELDPNSADAAEAKKIVGNR